MKIKNVLLLLFFFTGILSHGTAQIATVSVITTDGQEHNLSLWEDGQLYFDQADRLVIQTSPNSPFVFPLSEIQKIVFSEITDVEESSESKPQILPNPSHDHFIVKNLPDNCPGRIFTLDGRLVMAFEAIEGMMIDISNLSPGMYLLHIDGQILKLMKQ